MQPRSAKKHVILIVDDEPRILDSVRMNLELEGYQVFEATNGQEALDKTLPIVTHTATIAATPSF